MIGAIALLLMCQLLGEALHRLTGIPLPGAVLGLLLLLLWFVIRPRERPVLSAVATWLIAHLSIMFVPAAVGLMQQGAILSRYGAGIVIATAISTILTLLVTVSVFRVVARRQESPSR
ncbi:CidA/LrgA family protein [Lichenifustis flavocetrariae]|uniref:CidA/LrgA family protein n=1 Tax=Lichenifustis flavocetrariae TaxID=2949735 RepID=A0AA41Z007_9HYPH|nr:CidA/LrgA family protein [Lichenifustis flavocetrariae]MCW6510421.1 CidA/LrgA family protein [Lichenifustis flavocetrariae]